MDYSYHTFQNLHASQKDQTKEEDLISSPDVYQLSSRLQRKLERLAAL